MNFINDTETLPVPFGLLSTGFLLLLFLLICFVMIYQRGSSPPIPVVHSIIIGNYIEGLCRLYLFTVRIL